MHYPVNKLHNPPHKSVWLSDYNQAVKFWENIEKSGF